jgi:plasmid maintenance system killer protein
MSSENFGEIFILEFAFDICHVISINEQRRICFRFIDGDAYDVEMTDYH